LCSPDSLPGTIANIQADVDEWTEFVLSDNRALRGQLTEKEEEKLEKKLARSSAQLDRLTVELERAQGIPPHSQSISHAQSATVFTVPFDIP
jgi:hypothetical protein